MVTTPLGNLAVLFPERSLGLTTTPLGNLAGAFPEHTLGPTITLSYFSWFVSSSYSGANNYIGLF